MFLLMLLENIFPPIPSELIMPLAGFASAGGAMSWWGAVIAGTLGSVAGAWDWYEFGRWLGRDRLARWVALHGRWVAVTPAEFARVNAWFGRWGAWVLALGRCVPGVRGVICIPAGVAAMSRPLFALACTAGSFAWCVLLVEAGRMLGARYAQVGSRLGPVSVIMLGIGLLIYASRVARRSGRERSSS